MKLRLQPADARRLRTAAQKAGLDVSAYVALILDDPGRVPVLESSSEAALATISRLSLALAGLPDEMTRTRGELGRAFGLLKHLFENPASVLDAERHAYALAAATRDARDAIVKVEAAAERLLGELAPIREDLVPVTRALAARYRRDREESA